MAHLRSTVRTCNWPRCTTRESEALYSTRNGMDGTRSALVDVVTVDDDGYRCEAIGCDNPADWAYIGEGGDMFLCEFHGGKGEVDGWVRIEHHHHGNYCTRHAPKALANLQAIEDHMVVASPDSEPN